MRLLLTMTGTTMICLLPVFVIVEAQERADASRDAIWIGLENGTEAEAVMASEPLADLVDATGLAQKAPGNTPGAVVGPGASFPRQVIPPAGS